MKMLLLWLLATMVGAVWGYPYGPPVEACGKMFPTGHGSDAMTIDPPYKLEVTPETLNRTNQPFTVTLRVNGTGDLSYFEGMFVQARMASCYNEKPVGSFTPIGDDNFTRLMNCHEGRPNSAISHKVSRHINDMIQFNWTSPSSMPGHIYFRATVVKNKTTFWTNVFSPFVRDISDMRKIPDKYCDVCKTEAACKASSIAAVTSLIVAALGFSFFWQ